jgi:uncharacterized protein (TIGR04255 family)
MSQPFAELERPPIVELVLGVQFAPLMNFTSGHLGWFWKQYLSKEWDRVADTPPLGDQFETFDEQRRWRFPGVELRLEPGLAPPRLQISNQARDRLVQVQPTRFHYNWQKKDTTYPSYRQIRTEFEHHLDLFRKFVAEAGLGKLLLNQWELTYVDCVPQGELWQAVTDWHDVVPGLVARPASVEGLKPENSGVEWSFEIGPKRGRLHVTVNQVRWGEKKELVLLIQTTARGPIGKNADRDLHEGLDWGHDAAVRAFLAYTSPRAKKYWGLKG